jgi:hypothetical protein
MFWRIFAAFFLVMAGYYWDPVFRTAVETNNYPSK